MADYHILDCSHRKDEVRVAYHIPVPAETNMAEKTLASCLTETEGFTGASAVPGLEPTEAAQIAGGEVCEHVFTVKFSANLTDNQKRLEVEMVYSDLLAVVQSRIREKFRFWGFSGSIT